MVSGVFERWAALWLAHHVKQSCYLLSVLAVVLAFLAVRLRVLALRVVRFGLLSVACSGAVFSLVSACAVLGSCSACALLAFTSAMSLP